jgi:hypothetical protein
MYTVIEGLWLSALVEQPVPFSEEEASEGK